VKKRVTELKQIGDRLFSKRQPLLTFWQEVADNFYPIRADFTRDHTLSDRFADHLMTGLPVLMHRGLSNAIAVMLRPTDKMWFHARTQHDALNERPEALQWLDMATSRTRRLMYDPLAQFQRATKQADADFTAFGNAVITVEPRRSGIGILFRSWHLKDVVWCENEELVIDTVHLNWDIEAASLCRMFPKTVAKAVERIKEKEPYKEIKCRRIIMPADNYDYDENYRGRKLPYVSLYIDCENDTLLEEVPLHDNPFVIPRWLTKAGSQYAYSPAAYIALPDARLFQQMTLTLLEAGQKAVDPPLVGTDGLIAGQVNAYAGGITWVDQEYDDKRNQALQPLLRDMPQLNWGEKREERLEAFLKDAFFLNQISIPMVTKDMTAYEVQKHFEDFVRQTSPLFEPLQVEYNGGICEKTFGVAMRTGVFGSVHEIPETLRGQDVRWVFESPIQDATERAKSQAYMTALQTIAASKESVDPMAGVYFKNDKALPEALLGGGVPADWITDAEEAAKLKQAAEQQQAQQMAQQQALQLAGGMAEVAGRAGEAGVSLKEAGVLG
jgi:hypothetical protein